MTTETPGRKCCMCHKPVQFPMDYCSVTCRERDEQLQKQTPAYAMSQAELRAKVQ